MSEKRDSLQRQLAPLKTNLLKIEEQKTEFIDSKSVPLDLEENEKLTRDQIKDIEKINAPTQPISPPAATPSADATNFRATEHCGRSL